MYIIFYSKAYVNLALQEIKAIIGNAKKLDEGIATSKKINDSIKRLAYAKKISEILFEAKDIDTIKEWILNSDILKYYSKDFAFRKISGTNIKYSSTKKRKTTKAYDNLNEKEFAEFVGKRISDLIKEKKSKKKLKINLRSPKTLFELLFIKDKIYFCKSVYLNKQNFSSRSPNNNEIFMPISLKPRLSRALVNISCKIDKVIFVDPFCGIGGILIEACLSGLKCYGNDIDERMVWASIKNVKKWCSLSVDVFHNDAIDFLDTLSKSKNKFCIATDPPYSKNTKNINKKDLYEKFFNKIKSMKNIERVVIMLPLFIGRKYDKRERTISYYESLMNDLDYKMIEEIYVHKSLSRLVYLISYY